MRGPGDDNDDWLLILALLLFLLVVTGPAEAGALEDSGGCREAARAAVEPVGGRISEAALREEYVACMGERGYLGPPVENLASAHYPENHCLLGGFLYGGAFILSWLVGVVTFGASAKTVSRWVAGRGPDAVLEACSLGVGVAVGVVAWMLLASIARVVMCW